MSDGTQDIVTGDSRLSLPSIEALAREIAGPDELDDCTMAIARTTHSRLRALSLRNAPTCSSCRHHTVFCRSVPVLHCMHPAIASTKRDVVHGRTDFSTQHCDTEREDQEISTHGRVILCGAEGRLYEPLVLPWFFPTTRALLRKALARP